MMMTLIEEREVIVDEEKMKPVSANIDRYGNEAKCEETDGRHRLYSASSILLMSI